MPELPEVEAIRLSLKQCVLHRKISKMHTSDTKVVRFSDASFREIQDKPIRALKRKGKHLLIFFGQSDCMLQVHLGMTGFVFYKKHFTDTPFRRVSFQLDKGWLFFDDMRKFGFLDIVSDTIFFQKILSQLGPDALTEKFTAHQLYSRARHRKCAVHALLLDQHFVAGLGNIYASEILFQAGISPFKRSCYVSMRDWETILKAMKDILARAVTMNGSTYVDHPAGGMDKEFYRHFLRVYRKEGEQCSCCGALIQRVKKQRSIYFCPQCQQD